MTGKEFIMRSFTTYTVYQAFLWRSAQGNAGSVQQETFWAQEMWKWRCQGVDGIQLNHNVALYLTLLTTWRISHYEGGEWFMSSWQAVKNWALKIRGHSQDGCKWGSPRTPFSLNTSVLPPFSHSTDGLYIYITCCSSKERKTYPNILERMKFDAGTFAFGADELLCGTKLWERRMRQRSDDYCSWFHNTTVKPIHSFWKWFVFDHY